MAKGKLPEDTPLIKQFFSVKAEHPEAVLLYRVGDFYESYSSDAVLVSKVLGLVLTKKSNGEKGYIEMAGFPHHAIDVYLPKLVRAGHKVAVCDQLEDPKLTKKLVKRGVTELVTPGITFNDQLLDQKENNFLAGLTFEKDLCGAAFLDVSTGTFQVTQGSLDYVGTLLASLAPKEIVVQRGCEKGVRAKYGDDLYISTLEEWAFVYDAAEEKLKKQFGVKSLKGFAVDRYPLGICSAGALLVYLEQTRHTGLRNICSLSRIDGDRFVWMDKFTIRNLELFDSSAGGEGVSLISVIDRCSSPMGSRMLRNWLAMPVMDIRELNSRYDAVSHFVAAEEDRNALQEMIGGIGDLERIISRAATGKIMPREIMQLGRGLGHMEPISSLCSGRGVAALDNLIAGMKDCSELLQTITTTMAPEPAAAIGKGEVIARGIDPELDELRNISSGGKDYLLALQRSEAERTGITSLKIGKDILHPLPGRAGGGGGVHRIPGCASDGRGTDGHREVRRRSPLGRRPQADARRAPEVGHEGIRRQGESSLSEGPSRGGGKCREGACPGREEPSGGPRAAGPSRAEEETAPQDEGRDADGPRGAGIRRGRGA